MMRWVSLFGCFGLSLLLGCGGPSGPTLHPVAGHVTMDGTPLSGARVLFIPQGDTQGHGGDGVTGANGEYEITAARLNSKGLPAGTYKIVVTRQRMPDGSIPPPDVPPIESDAKETVPEPYSDFRNTPFTATVKPGESTPFDFRVDTDKK